MLRLVPLFAVALLLSVVFAQEETCSANGICTASTISVPKGANPEGKPRQAEKKCVDRHKQCIGFQKNGECQKNPGWMIINCPKSCNACHLRDPVVRCSRTGLNISTSPIYGPGDLDRMFGNITERFGHQYNVNVVSTSPWVVTFDNFVSPEEAKALISTQKKFERSTDSGQTNEFGETGRILSSGRTSANSWCDHDCREV
jgi:hypothetical protein